MTTTSAAPPTAPAVADPLLIAGRSFASRLLVGTGKFASSDLLRAAIIASGSEIVTVALRRVDLTSGNDPQLNAIDTNSVLLLPNTSGARTAEEAIRLANLARELAGHSWLKLEVTPDPATLLPDPIETWRAADALVKNGFTVLPFINADPVLALRLQDVGCATVMPLGAPIGTNRGIKTKDQIRIIIEQARVPVVVDAGLGVPSHAAEAMEMGADAVLVNTALAVARDPIAMAYAFKKGVEAGREAYLAGPGQIAERAAASSPLTGFLRES